MASARITILGCGGSGGVPLATGWWGACDPQNPKNARLRASIAIQTDTQNIIIDTGPDFRTQVLRAGIQRIDAVLYTHAHSDHVNGIDELRYVYFAQKKLMPVYGDLETISELQSRFSHMFVASADGLYESVVTPHVFANEAYGKPYTIGDLTVTPYRQLHGTAGRSVGYRMGNFAYSTDVSGLDDVAFEALSGIDTWLVDCGQFGSDFVVVHPNLDVVKAWNARVGARHVILTHLTPRVDFSAMQAALPAGFEPAYDGMQINISL